MREIEEALEGLHESLRVNDQFEAADAVRDLMSEHGIQTWQAYRQQLLDDAQVEIEARILEARGRTVERHTIGGRSAYTFG